MTYKLQKNSLYFGLSDILDEHSFNEMVAVEAKV